MKYDKINRTFDCEPTLTDTQILDFCRDGYLILEGVIDDETNQLTCAYLNGELPSNPSYIPEGLNRRDLERIRNSHEPSTLYLEEWFIDKVVLNPQVTGVLRSLLGRNVGLPVLMSRHTTNCPSPSQGWHHDGGFVSGPKINFIEVFYVPQDTPPEMGPTEIVPTSHLDPPYAPELAVGVSSGGPAGTLAVHSQSILHRKSDATASGVRHMLKYDYWRTVSPERDWIIEPDFNLGTALSDRIPRHLTKYVADMYNWLCGIGDDFLITGGQSGPGVSENLIGPPYGPYYKGESQPGAI